MIKSLLLTCFVATSMFIMVGCADVSETTASEPLFNAGSDQFVLMDSETEDVVITEEVVEDNPPLYYFYYALCFHCISENEQEFIGLYNELHGELKEEFPMKLVMINAFDSHGSGVYDATLSEYGIEHTDVLPAVIVDGVILTGTDIQDKLSGQCVSAHES